MFKSLLLRYPISVRTSALHKFPIPILLIRFNFFQKKKNSYILFQLKLKVLVYLANLVYSFSANNINKGFKYVI